MRHVSRGETVEDAARLAGIGRATLWRWLQAGRAGDPRFAPLADGIDRARRGGTLARLTRRAGRDLDRYFSRNRCVGIGTLLSSEPES